MMRECVMCGIQSNSLNKCKRCGDYFCDDCGSVEDKLCLFCMDDVSDDENWNVEFKEEEEEEEEDPW